LSFGFQRSALFVKLSHAWLSRTSQTTKTRFWYSQNRKECRSRYLRAQTGKPYLWQSFSSRLRPELRPSIFAKVRKQENFAKQAFRFHKYNFH